MRYNQIESKNYPSVATILGSAFKSPNINNLMRLQINPPPTAIPDFIRQLIWLRHLAVEQELQPSKLMLGKAMLTILRQSLCNTNLIIEPGTKLLGLIIEVNESDPYYLEIKTNVDTKHIMIIPYKKQSFNLIPSLILIQFKQLDKLS